jgi:transcriptional regulator with XRE-family HTH domain
MAKLSRLPRATWANIESGAANPTLNVLHRVAAALQVSIEELIATPRAEVHHYPKGELPVRRRGEVIVSTLLPDEIPGMLIERLELPQDSRLIGVPHTAWITRKWMLSTIWPTSSPRPPAMSSISVGDISSKPMCAIGSASVEP